MIKVLSFLTNENCLAGHSRGPCGQHVARGPRFEHHWSMYSVYYIAHADVPPPARVLYKMTSRFAEDLAWSSDSTNVTKCKKMLNGSDIFAFLIQSNVSLRNPVQS